MDNFPTQIPNRDSHSPPLLDLFLFSNARICSEMAFPTLGNSDHVVVSISIDFLLNSQQDARFTKQLMTILMLIGMVFVIIREMFHGRISLSSVLLSLLVNFVSGFWLELIYISLIEKIRSNLIHLHDFQLLGCCHSSQKLLFSFVPKGQFFSF